MIRAIIFDFDGVILESAVIKTEAFGNVVNEYPKEQAEQFVAYHMSHMGISRHVKFRYFIEEILGEPYSEDEEKKLADKFESIVYEQVMKCPFVSGAIEFLERNHKKYDFYIASGTPNDEMHHIVKGRGLERYFKDIYGTPLSKTEIIEKIISEHGYSRNEVFFVGDAGTDLCAAEATKLRFIGRTTKENEEVFAEIKHKISDLRQIEDIIEDC